MDSRFISHGQTTACEPKCCRCPRGEAVHRAECPAGAGNVDTVCHRLHKDVTPDPTATMTNAQLDARYSDGRADGYADHVEGSVSDTAELAAHDSAYRIGYADGVIDARERWGA